MNKILIIPIIISVLSLGVAAAFIAMDSDTQTGSTAVIPEFKSYKYYTICDIDDLETFMIEEVWVTTMQITTGHHNDDPRVAEFFKTNELLSGLQRTPEKMLTPSIDPIEQDVMFWMPLTLDIVGASPEVIEVLSPRNGVDQTEYESRAYSEWNRCE